MAKNRTGAVAESLLNQHCVQEAIERGIIKIDADRITYNLKQSREYVLTDPEEPVRAFTIAWLIITKGYPAARIGTEVTVPRRTPTDFADVVLFSDDRCIYPWLVVENKAPGRNEAEQRQAVEQGFGNANSLRASFMLYEEGGAVNSLQYCPLPSYGARKKSFRSA